MRYAAMAGFLCLVGAAASLCGQGAASAPASKPSSASRPAGSAFVSKPEGGKWSAVGTWQSQDGAAPTRTPREGDTVTLKGQVTVDAPVGIGNGSGEAIELAPGKNAGDVRLVVAAPMTVRGGMKIGTNSMVEVQAGAGIELDADEGATPVIHGIGFHLYMRGEKDKRCFLRTKAGSVGRPGRVMPDGASPANVGAAFADFTDMGTDKYFGIAALPSQQPLMASIGNCTFTRASLSYSGFQAKKTPFTVSDCVFEQTPPVQIGDMTYCASFAGEFEVSVLRCGFDRRVNLDQPKELKSNVFAGNIWPHRYRAEAFKEWADNLVVSNEPVCGYFTPQPGVYKRTYILCTSPVDNAHGTGATGPIVFDQCAFDTPLTKGYVDDTLMVSGTVEVRRCLTLPRVGGEHPGCGPDLSYLMGGPAVYENNTVALGHEAAIHSDPSHKGRSGEITSFKNNLFYVLDSVPKATGKIFVTFGGLKDPVKPEDCDYNNRWRTEYGQIEITTGGKLGAHDVQADPKFVDPTRNLTTFYRAQKGVTPEAVEKDVTNALAWIRRHPEKMTEMIDWVFAGYVPTNPELRAAGDAQGPTKGWIGAMEGNPSSQPASGSQPAASRPRGN